MPHWLYTLLVSLLLPAAAFWLTWRGWRNPAHRGSLRSRFAIGLQPRQDRPLWLHAASVGEVQSLAGLVRRFQQKYPQRRLLITVASSTGVTRAEALFAAETRSQSAGLPRVTVMLSPFDLPGIARRFLGATHPIAGVFVETEIWPNLISVAAHSGVPLTMVSARVSEASTRSYLRYTPGLVRSTLLRFRNIGAQSDADAQRFIKLGADPAGVQVIGNLKFDFPIPEDLEARGGELRSRYATARGMWIAGSTQPGEEEICLAAHRILADRMKSSPAPLMVLAPRKPERFDAVAEWLSGKGVRFARRSIANLAGVRDPDTATLEVLLVDKLGELLAFYAAGDVAFVGGSLVPVGGHNLLEPAALGKPTITGPHSFNSPEAARLLDDAGALSKVTDANSLADELYRFFTDPAAAAAQGNRAAAAVVANRGAAERALAMVESSLPAAE